MPETKPTTVVVTLTSGEPRYVPVTKRGPGGRDENLIFRFDRNIPVKVPIEFESYFKACSDYHVRPLDTPARDPVVKKSSTINDQELTRPVKGGE